MCWPISSTNRSLPAQPGRARLLADRHGKLTEIPVSICRGLDGTPEISSRIEVGEPPRKYTGEIKRPFGVRKPVRHRPGTLMVLIYRDLKYASPEFS